MKLEENSKVLKMKDFINNILIYYEIVMVAALALVNYAVLVVQDKQDRIYHHKYPLKPFNMLSENDKKLYIKYDRINKLLSVITVIFAILSFPGCLIAALIGNLYVSRRTRIHDRELLEVQRLERLRYLPENERNKELEIFYNIDGTDSQFDFDYWLSCQYDRIKG